MKKIDLLLEFILTGFATLFALFEMVNVIVKDSPMWAIPFVIFVCMGIFFGRWCYLSGMHLCSVLHGNDEDDLSND